MESNLTDLFIEALLAFSEKPISEAIRNQVKLSLLDYLGCVIAGAAESFNKSRAFLLPQDGGITSVIGTDVRTSLNQALMLNGYHSHVLELDDGHRFGMMHPGVTVFSCALALAQNENWDCDTFIKAVVYGYEVSIRLAAAVQPGHKVRGYHTSATCGTVGAAAGIALALGFDRKALKTVLSAAATDAAGILQIQEDESALKPYNIARACSAAVNAVRMGRTGLTGPDDILGGSQGFFSVMTDTLKPDYLTEGFDGYAIESIYRKSYAACRHCHSAIEAAIAVRACCDGKWDMVDAIRVDTYKLAIKGHDHKKILGPASAKMSIPYAVATAFMTGRGDDAVYEEPFCSREDILAFTQKIEICEDEALTQMCPAKRAAILTVRVGEKTYTHQVDYPKGEPENPLTEDELVEKYRSLMAISKTEPKQAQFILDSVLNLETAFDDLMEQI